MSRMRKNQNSHVLPKTASGNQNSSVTAPCRGPSCTGKYGHRPTNNDVASSTQITS